MDLAVGDIWQLRVVCKLADQMAINTTYWFIDNPGVPARNDAQFAIACDSQFAGPYKGVMAPAAAYVQCQVQRVDPLPPTVPAIGAAGAGAGTRTGDPLPRQSCGVITWLTNFAGRAYRGRIYLPFPAEGDNDADSTPVAAYLTQATALANAYNNFVAFTSGGVTASFHQVLVHHASQPIAPTPVTNYRVNDKWGTQRRRGSYGRQNP